MTRDEVLALIKNDLARPNDTYVSSVLPNRLDEAIDIIERKWDWGFQYLEQPITVAASANELVFSVANRSLKEVNGDIYNVAEQYVCRYKRFYPFMVSATPARPSYYTVSPDKRIYLSSKVLIESIFYVPLRAYTTDYTEHPLFTSYPVMTAGYATMLCKRDFVGKLDYSMDAWVKDYQTARSKVKEMNDSEKDIPPSIVPLNYDIRRDLTYQTR